MSERNFFLELKRRNVYKVAVAYAVVGWLLIQIATQVFPFLEIPNWVVRLVIALVAIGFPIALIIAWAFELTPEGIKRTDDPAIPAAGVSKNCTWIYVAAVGAAFSIGLFFMGRYTATPRQDASADRTGAATTMPAKSIAVLPFENLSRDPDNAFFTDGVQDEILSHLAKVADLKVISRTSVLQYKRRAARNLRAIGKQLGVAHLLEGSVQRTSSRVLIIAQLIDVRTDAHLWAQTYDRDLADVFAIQTDIARAIADQLKAKLSPNEQSAIERRPTADVVAFDLYSRAKSLLLTTGVNSNTIAKNFPEAIELLTQAVTRDRSFFRAYCLLAYVHDREYLGRERTPERLALAQAALDAAARLEPDAGEMHLARAQHLYSGYYDYSGAVAELEIARRTLPNEARIPELLGLIARRQGKWEESLRHFGRALELDPRSFLTLQQIGQNYDEMRRYSEAAAAYDRVLAVYPDNIEARIDRVSVDVEWKADARALHRMFEELRQKDPAAYQQHQDNVLYLALAEHDRPAAEAALAAGGTMLLNSNAGMAFVARLTGDEEKAPAAFRAGRDDQEKIVQAQPNDGRALSILAFYDAALGRKEEALRNGRRAMEILPRERDAVFGTRVMTVFAVTAAWAGEKDLALEQLARVAQLPAGPSYGDLKLN